MDSRPCFVPFHNIRIRITSDPLNTPRPARGEVEDPGRARIMRKEDDQHDDEDAPVVEIDINVIDGDLPVESGKHDLCGFQYHIRRLLTTISIGFQEKLAQPRLAIISRSIDLLARSVLYDIFLRLADHERATHARSRSRPRTQRNALWQGSRLFYLSNADIRPRAIVHDPNSWISPLITFLAFPRTTPS